MDMLENLQRNYSYHAKLLFVNDIGIMPLHWINNAELDVKGIQSMFFYLKPFGLKSEENYTITARLFLSTFLDGKVGSALILFNNPPDFFKVRKPTDKEFLAYNLILKNNGGDMYNSAMEKIGECHFVGKATISDFEI